jgi:hypothetical protein
MKKNKIERQLHVVRNRVASRGVDHLNTGSYARNYAIKAIEGALGKAVVLAPNAFTITERKISVPTNTGRKRQKKEKVISVALKNGSNILIAIN